MPSERRGGRQIVHIFLTITFTVFFSDSDSPSARMFPVTGFYRLSTPSLTPDDLPVLPPILLPLLLICEHDRDEENECYEKETALIGKTL